MKDICFRLRYLLLRLIFRIRKWFSQSEETIPEENSDSVKMRLKQLPHSEILSYDKNNDGKVDEKDVRALVEDILSGNSDLGMDVNEDGEIDISDVVGLVNIILEIERERELSTKLLGFDFVDQPSNVIRYKTYNNKPCDIFNKDGFGAEIVANTYNDYGIIVFNGTITSIPNYAFYFGTEITALSIPKKVRNIGAHAFANCKRLETIVLGDSIEKINLVQSLSEGGSFAFDDCINLKNIISLAKEAPAIDWSTFRDMGNITDRKLYIERSSNGYEEWLSTGVGFATYLGNYGFVKEYI